ncbi:MAG: SMP-30/gluconolactonase/LRE family protein [Alphaproteobacteria bacterium]
MSAPEVARIVACNNKLGECATWSVADRALYWTDIEGKAVWRHDPATGDSLCWPAPDRVGSFALCGGDRFLLALPTSVVLWHPQRGVERVVAAAMPGQAAGTRLNDGRCDRQGRFVVGGFDETTRAPIASLWRVERDGTVTTLVDGGIVCANSTCFTADGATMYFADTPQRSIVAYDYDAAPGTQLGRMRQLTDFAEQPGRPDGSTVDAEGYVWNAQVFGHRIVRYAPDGRVDRVVEVPMENPTSVSFGGPDLDVLYVTSLSRSKAIPDWKPGPDDGCIHAFRPGVRGLPEPLFAGA